MNRLILILALLPALRTSSSAQDAPPGLLFTYDNEQHNGTSLDLTHSGAVATSGPLLLSFEMCVVNPDVFGYLLHGRLDDTTSVRMGYAKFYDRDTSYLVLSINDDPTLLKIPLSRQDLHIGAWHSVSLMFDPIRQCLSGSLNGKVIQKYTVSLPRNLNVKLVLGNDGTTDEVPAMALRNIGIQTVEHGDSLLRLSHQWPLRESAGGYAADVVGGLTANVEKGTWLAESHVHWRLLASIPVLDGITSRPAHDPARSRLLFTGIHSLLEYSLLTDKLNGIPYEKPRPSVAAQPDYDPIRDRLYGHHPGGGQISTYDPESSTWSAIDTLVGLQGDYNHHASWIDPVRGDIYLFGGYGWYTVKRTLCRYSFGRGTWEIVPLSGNVMEPRRGIALCQASIPGQYYILGGEGNSSGKQEAGFHFFVDLWRLDLPKRTMKNLWRGPDGTENNRVLGLVNAGENRLYALFGPTAHRTSPLQLYAMSTTTPARGLAGDSMDIKSYQWPSLFFDSLSQQMIVVAPVDRNKDTVDVRIYALAYPPMNRTDLVSSTILSGTPNSDISLIVVIIVLTVSIPAYLYSRKRRITIARQALVSPPTSAVVSRRPAIEVFGRFRVTDSNGDDITSEFSSRIRQMFLLILFHTRYDGNQFGGGISIENLTTTLWPEAGARSAKNSRGVALKAVRDLLARVGNVSIVGDYHAYRINVGEGIDCDFQQYQRERYGLKLAKAATDESSVKGFIQITAKGSLLPETSHEWLDPLKAHVLSDVEEICLRIVNEPERAGNSGLKLQAADVLLKWDPVNEIAMRTKVRALATSGHHGAAKATFDQFTAQFRSMYDRPYATLLKDLLIEP